MSKKRKTIGKPSRAVYFLAYHICKIMFFFKGVKVKYDNSALDELEGPALLLCPHTCAYDPVFVGSSAYPKRLTFVVSEHFMAKPLLRFALTKLAHVITKKMFCPDASTIMNIMRAKQEGNVIALFPEGRLNSAPRSHPVTAGTAHLVKKLGVNVYCVTANGASLLHPKWSGVMRKGEVEVISSKLLDADEIKNLTVDEIENIIDAAILHDDEKAACGREFKVKDTTLGLDGILYKCPECESEFTLEADNCEVRCTHCGFKTTLDTFSRFSGCRFETVNGWFDWQIDSLDLSLPLESEIDVGALDEKGNMDYNAGRAHISLDENMLVFKGEVFGKPLEFEKATQSIGGTPYTPKREFDVYHDKHLLYLMPDDRKTVVKWTLFVDKAVSVSKKENLK